MCLSRIEKRTVVVLSAYVLCSVLFGKLYFASTSEWSLSTTQQLVDFSAYKPFQYRILIPAIMRGLHDVLHVDNRTIFKLFTLLFVMLTFVSFRWLLDRLFLWQFSDIGALFILYPMVWNYCIYGHFRAPYDIPAIVLFILGLCALLADRWCIYYSIFILGTLNRESIFILTAVFFLVKMGSMSRPRLVLHIAAQITAWMTIKILLSIAFRSNGGVLFQNQLPDNLKVLTNPSLWSPYLFAFGCLWILAIFVWREAHPIVKRMLLIAIPYPLAMVFVANLNEIRIYNEFVPVFALVGICALKSVFGAHIVYRGWGSRPREVRRS
jgi:hypothetical protein